MIKQLIYKGNLEQLRKIVAQEGVEKVKCNTDINELASIHWASNANHLEIVRFLLNDPVNEDCNLVRGNNFTPLHSAAMNGNTQIVEYLISKGANINVQTQPQGYAPIHSASFAGHLETIKVLVKNGADLSLKNYRDELPIDTAKRQNQVETVGYFEGLK